MARANNREARNAAIPNERTTRPRFVEHAPRTCIAHQQTSNIIITTTTEHPALPNTCFD
ncbi:MAG TPA: hypothetical protein VH165_13885 [Kofleriaceae bacterium]|nr:hypothetical protein [Kofleriaceae bacterium]